VDAGGGWLIFALPPPSSPSSQQTSPATRPHRSRPERGQRLT
jgi:hypothetical protein